MTAGAARAQPVSVRHTLPSTLLGAGALLLLLTHTVLWAVPLYICILAKVVVPWGPWRRVWGRAVLFIAERWIDTNSFFLDLIHRFEWDVEGLEGLRRHRSYLLSSNHQSWTDIVVLQHAFNRRIPFLRFFIKDKLIWVPILGIAWWALDMPFMKRYSRETLEKHPELRGQDLEATRRSCERMRHVPVTITNFLEGTRFTVAKHRVQESPYRHLLKPKAGGVAFVLGAMGDQLPALLDVTIVYPEFTPTIWDFLCRRVTRIVVRVTERPIPGEFSTGSYMDDPAFRHRIQAWVGEQWAEKDALIDRLLPPGAGPALAADPAPSP
jgi:1-acyl-sn-glycerol-3-phosphate acyltransferase